MQRAAHHSVVVLSRLSNLSSILEAGRSEISKSDLFMYLYQRLTSSILEDSFYQIKSIAMMSCSFYLLALAFKDSYMSLIISYFVIMFISHICLFDDVFVCYFYYSYLAL